MDKIMETLGQERIDRICKEKGLSEEDRKDLKKIFEKWEEIEVKSSLDEIQERAHAAVDAIGNDPKRTRIIRAAIEISAEYMTQRDKDRDDRAASSRPL